MLLLLMILLGWGQIDYLWRIIFKLINKVIGFIYGNRDEWHQSRLDFPEFEKNQIQIDFPKFKMYGYILYLGRR